MSEGEIDPRLCEINKFLPHEEPAYAKWELEKIAEEIIDIATDVDKKVLHRSEDTYGYRHRLIDLIITCVALLGRFDAEKSDV